MSVSPISYYYMLKCHWTIYLTSSFFFLFFPELVVPHGGQRYFRVRRQRQRGDNLDQVEEAGPGSGEQADTRQSSHSRNCRGQ